MSVSYTAVHPWLPWLTASINVVGFLTVLHGRELESGLPWALRADVIVNAVAIFLGNREERFRLVRLVERTDTQIHGHSDAQSDTRTGQQRMVSFCV
ncbi:hypothetical protein L218DRAFT_746554 [Marasmius fiardii PR-910]|nr:hypothetical protein L218DRAFT_746554 [Marasmius fiardii PR-910]